MDKVAVIGFTNSGKTSYLIGMYSKMREGMKNFSLSAIETETDFYLREMWKRIQSGKGREWPAPTSDNCTYNFTLQHSCGKIIDFELIEYKTSLLDDTYYQHQIDGSECLLVLVNGESFAFTGNRKSGNLKPVQAKNGEDYKRIVASNLKNNGDLMTIRRLHQMAQEGIVIPPVAIVITKRDLIPSEYIQYISEIIQENFSPIFMEISKPHHLVMLSAVTLGEGIEDGADAYPEDIEHPIAYAMLSILCQRIKNVKLTMLNAQSNLSAKDTFWNSFSGYVMDAACLLDIFDLEKQCMLTV